MPPISLQGKPIAITGASSGIGAATAIACARAGMPVAIAARRTDKLEAVARHIQNLGQRVLIYQLDVTKPADCQRFIDTVLAEFGSLYAVYANAGYGVEAPIHEMTDRQMRDIFETNYFGTLNTIWPAIPHLIKAKAGHILICSSCLAKMTIPFYAAYSATKAAQNHIGRAMRLELRPYGVQVSTVHPISTTTEFFDQVKTRGSGSELVAHTPAGFTQTPDFVAARTISCLRRPIPEVWTGLAGNFTRFGMLVSNLFPRFGDFFIRGMVSQRLRNNERHAERLRDQTPAPHPGSTAPGA